MSPNGNCSTTARPHRAVMFSPNRMGRTIQVITILVLAIGLAMSVFFRVMERGRRMAITALIAMAKLLALVLHLLLLARLVKSCLEEFIRLLNLENK